MKVIVYRKRLLWRIKIVARNGEPVLVSESYYSKGNAERSARIVRAALGLK